MQDTVPSSKRVDYWGENPTVILTSKLFVGNTQQRKLVGKKYHYLTTYRPNLKAIISP